ncbi:MAG: epoxyqueuosine reductase QueH [Desulfobacterales bacterium]|nr:epoxyqueuosine reductase QueH [Desulfobacterales bacterium]
MKILLHTCCGPCTIYPLKVLREQSIDVMGYYYRSNIHPYTECIQRENTLKTYAEEQEFKVILESGYHLEDFLRHMVFREKDRCQVCYYLRLSATAHIAKQGAFDYFSSTLLYSKYQQHELIQSIGNSIGQSLGVPFYYQDFRIGWKEGIQVSKSLNMYRQQYCGCIFSEKERYVK